MTINEIQDEIIDEFEAFDDWMDRYQLIVDYAKDLDRHPLPESDKTEQNKIDGCQSTVWFTAHMEDGLLVFNGDSDAGTRYRSLVAASAQRAYAERDRRSAALFY